MYYTYCHSIDRIIYCILSLLVCEKICGFHFTVCTHINSYYILFAKLILLNIFQSDEINLVLIVVLIIVLFPQSIRSLYFYMTIFRSSPILIISILFIQNIISFLIYFLQTYFLELWSSDFIL